MFFYNLVYQRNFRNDFRYMYVLNLIHKQRQERQIDNWLMFFPSSSATPGNTVLLRFWYELLMLLSCQYRNVLCIRSILSITKQFGFLINGLYNEVAVGIYLYSEKKLRCVQQSFARVKAGNQKKVINSQIIAKSSANQLCVKKVKSYVRQTS